MTGHQRIQKLAAEFMLCALLLYTGAPLVFADATTTPATDAQTASTTPDTPSDATVTSGDSLSLTNSNNQINLDTTNSTTTSPDATTTFPDLATTTDATSTADASTTPMDDQATTTNATTTVTNDNAATLAATSTADAETGSNTAISGSGSALVVSGAAAAAANVLNVINTNITDSTGLIDLVNALNANGINLDTSGINNIFGQGSAGATTSCSLSSCSALTVNNTNQATVTNSVVVRASTGNNHASSTNDATVSTGDAYAAANVLNVVNTNLTNSNYLLLSLNNFGDLNGDVTLPGANFFEHMLGSALHGSAHTTNNNTATVDNAVSTDAQTGANTTEGTSSAVMTGDAFAAASSANLVNTNLTGGGSAYFLVNVFGNWTGNIQGLPSGMSWTPTPTGVLLSSNSGTIPSLAPTATTTNTNTASVNNNVSVYALTGQNEAQGSNASVSSGNAYAAANVLNVVNTNVVSQNWMLGILNVFGNWNGNLAFGHPDLWLGIVVEAGDPTRPGDTVTYQFTVANHGDADATNVALSAAYDPQMLQFANNATSWNLGDIPQGQSKEFDYTATVGSVPSGQSVEVPLSATVVSDETDGTATDSNDKVTLVVTSPDQGSGVNVQYTPDPILHVTKTASSGTVTPPGSVNYTIEVTNDGGPAYDATLYDTLTDETGHVIHQESWPLDEIDNGDDITVSYTMQYGTSTLPGVYTNTAQVKAIGRNPSTDPFYGDFADSPIATSTVAVLGGEVLGAETEAPVCGPLLTSYITQNGSNNPVQVRRLQFFLRDFDHAPLTPNGVYDPSTINAVEHFQSEYAADILAPWGMTKPTPNVYYTTEAKVNDMWCQGITQFPLSQTQEEAITLSRSHSK